VPASRAAPLRPQDLASLTSGTGLRGLERGRPRGQGRPEEAHEFAGDGDHGDRRAFPVPDQMPVPPVEALLTLLARADVLGLMERTAFEEVPEWTERYFAPQAEREFVSSARVTMADGRSVTDLRRFPHGHPKNPLSDAEVEAKFRAQCEPFLERPSETLEALWGLERAPSVAALMAKIVLREEG